jgi:hypothetical protein
MIGDRCYATVLLDEELWRSLTALEPSREVAWVHGCELDHGHDGDHHALAYRDGPLGYWLRWDERHVPHISNTDRPDPLTRDAAPRGEPRGQPPHAKPTMAAHSSTAESAVSENSGSQADALWAIAAALERLADVILGAPNPEDTPGRHAAGRDMHS